METAAKAGSTAGAAVFALWKVRHSSFTGPEMISLATYKVLSILAFIVHFTRVISPRSISIQVMQRGCTQLPVL